MRYLVLVSFLVVSSCSVTDQLFPAGAPSEPSQPSATLENASLTQETTGLDEDADIDAETDVDLDEDAVPAKSTGPKPTVAALGDPTKPGLWMETPLVSTQRSGRVTVNATGKSAEVTLIPIDGEVTAGSRLSLQGFQALGAPLTELIDLTVQPL